MPGSKYDRELRFIDNESRRITVELQDMREIMPQTPLEAEKKAMEVGLLEEKLGQLLTRKKEIEDSFLAAGLEIPDIHRNLNSNTCRDTASFDTEEEQPQVRLAEKAEQVQTRPVQGLDGLSSEVASITDELMQIEIRMLQAEISDDESEKQKLVMSANALRARRDDLVAQIKAQKAAPAEKTADDPMERRIAALESDNRALRSQISLVRSDVGEIKDQLRQILEALNKDL